MNDPWLLNNDNPYVQTTHEALDGKSIPALMITGQNEWDIDLINDISNEGDGNIILTIHIRHTDTDS